MDLRLDPSLAKGYKSPSQIARRVTEPWAEANLFCVACPSNRVVSYAANTKVMDLRCERCEASYQLKSLSHPFGRRTSNSAYEAKMAAIKAGRAPHYGFLQYSRFEWMVKGLFVVPGHFFTPAVIERRNALRPTAKRKGWVGSNILLHTLPPEARVVVVDQGRARPPGEVRGAWSRFAFLRQGAKGGWSADVLACVRRLQRETNASEFTTQQFYRRFQAELAARHPANRHVQDKIRQQLQLLRDGGVLEFVKPGQYRVVG